MEDGKNSEGVAMVDGASKNQQPTQSSGSSRSISTSSSSCGSRQPEVNGVSSDGSHLFVFTNEKAGMKSVDKERANRIIYEMSKNSSYFKQAELQDQKVDAKVAEMKNKLGKLDGPRQAQLARQADRIATEFELERELDAVCMVVDMDMFFAAVEIRDRPELAEKPVAVGGESMISTTNYHARKKGVRSAMPGFIGRKLCPELIFVKPDYEKYSRVAEKIRAIFREYDPRMRSYSLDEAYLNVTQALLRRLNEPAPAAAGANGAGASPSATDPTVSPMASGDDHGGPMPRTATQQQRRCDEKDMPGRSMDSRRVHAEAQNAGYTSEEGEEDVAVALGERSGWQSIPREDFRARMSEAARAMAEEIRGRIRETTKLTASVGIGPNFMLAKIASDWNKPDGQMCISGDRGEVLRFLHDLPVRKIGGVGKVTEKCLREAMGIVTCGDLFRERAACLHVMTPRTSKWLIKVSLGIGSSDHDVATEQAEAAGAITRKQISKERTFGELYRPQHLLAKCREICESLAADMVAKELEAKTVGLKVKTTKFQVRTLDHTGQSYVSTADDLYDIASSLLQKEIRAASTSAPGGVLRLRLMGIRASVFRGQAGVPPLPGQATLDGFLTRQQGTAQGTDDVSGAATTATEGVGNANKVEVDALPGVERIRMERGARESERDFHDDASRDGPGQQGGMSHLDVNSVSSATQRHLGEPMFGDPFRPGPLSSSTTGLFRREQSPQKAHGPWGESWTGVGFKTGGREDAPRAAAPTAVNVTCPVCGENLGIVSNAALNRHMDACLGVCTTNEDDGKEGLGLGLSATRAVGQGFGPRRLKPLPSRKRTKVATAGIEKFLLPKERI